MRPPKATSSLSLCLSFYWWWSLGRWLCPFEIVSSTFGSSRSDNVYGWDEFVKLNMTFGTLSHILMNELVPKLVDFRTWCECVIKTPSSQHSSLCVRRFVFFALSLPLCPIFAIPYKLIFNYHWQSSDNDERPVHSIHAVSRTCALVSRASIQSKIVSIRFACFQFILCAPRVSVCAWYCYRLRPSRVLRPRLWITVLFRFYCRSFL